MTTVDVLRPVVTLALREDAALERLDDGRLALVEGHVRSTFPELSPVLRAALESLAQGEVTEDDLFAAATQGPGSGDLTVLHLQMLLRRLETGGWLRRTLSSAGARLATLEPFGHVVAAPTRILDPAAETVLSRFAVLRPAGSLRGGARPGAPPGRRLPPPRRAPAVAALGTPTAPGSLQVEGLDGGTVLGLLQLMLDAGLLVAPDAEARPALDQWSSTDLLFHARSRVGRHLGGYGGTYRMEGRAAPLPAVRPAYPRSVELPRPPDDALASDPPFGEVIEARRSIREHDDDRPLTLAQLGEFLWRVGRVREILDDGRQELSSRPYPGGGACYETEIYPLVQLCDGVSPGLYHYDPSAHALGLVAEPDPRTKLLLEYGRQTGVMERPPQVMLLLAARFGRTMWKYESMAYALVLKQVGVLYQTMYLTATAMGLAPCALGGGNSDAFAAATGLDYYEETSVGEFLLGSRRTPASGV